ncbi:hypothetical protein ACS0TY_030965 [Phlomoides rotata]
MNSQIAVITVPFPAQGHLNQLLQISCLVSSYGIPVHYVGSAIHNRQAKVRINGLNRQHVSKIHFHDIPTPPFDSPPPDPNSTDKFPAQLQPAWDAALNLRHPDVASILNAESYAFNPISAFSKISYIWEGRGKPFPIQHPKELPSFEGLISDDIQYFVSLQSESMTYRAGDIYNTCRLIEAPLYANTGKCLEWLDKHESKSVIYISFGTTVSLSDEQIKELALGLEQSKVKFLWVLRDADKGDVFDGQVRRAQLPEGFEESVEGVGMVVRDWAPQPQILAHSSTGGFMSHCGWNSCMESITMGVPIVVWPMHSDQPRNTSLITDILKMALVVREWTPKVEVVNASTIENVVRRLMASEEGDEIRKRAEELGTTVRQATQPGGASRLELDSFIAHITRE